jgi:hypothetical protein
MSASGGVYLKVNVTVDDGKEKFSTRIVAVDLFKVFCLNNVKLDLSSALELKRLSASTSTA